MCGIAGRPGVLAPDFERTLQALAFRGPDQSGSVSLRDYTLGCRRLAITDVAATQPLVAGVEGRRQAIVMNGSIADPAAWRSELALRGEPCTTGNDAELPLRIWRALGVEGLRRLGGQFAFAIADEERGTLVLGRDRFGEKPLFVDAPRRGWPSFASTAAALRASMPDEAPRLDAIDAARFAWRGCLDLERSCFGLPLRSFPRGTIRVWSRDGVESFALSPPRPVTGGDDATLAALLRQAVAARVHGDRALGLFLSGGVDSAALAVTLSDLGLRPLCLSLDFENGRRESARAAAVAGALGMPHTTVSAGREMLDDLPDLVAQAGLPLGDASLLAVLALSRAAVARGVGIVLSGEGGDELFLGYRRQRAYAWARLGQRLVPEVWRRSLARGVQSGAAARFARAFASGNYGDLLAVAPRADVERLFGVRLPDEPAEDGEAMTTARQRDLDEYLAWDLLPKLDLASLGAGLEARSPLLDANLLAFAQRHVHGTGETQGKTVLRRYLATALPAHLRGGRKLGFAPPVADWLRGSALARDALLASTLFDATLARRWLGELEAGRGRGRAPLLFHLLALALFERRSARMPVPA
jgi:asparagine synthase (glutamine-hydrolysing)